MKKGWEKKKLGEVAKAIYGYTEKASYEEIGPKFLRITDIQDDGVNWNTVPYCKISDSELEKYELQTGDIVFARTGATTGKSYLLNNPPRSVFASYLIKVHINDKRLLPEYLYNYFQTQTYWDTINAGVSGSAQGGFNASKLSELDIPFPPPKEQQQIVSILDEAFATIEQATENVQRNLQNAKQLFQSELNSIFTKKGEGWVEKKIEDVTKVVNGFSFKSTDFSPNNKIKSIKITNVGVKEFVQEEANLLPEKFQETFLDYSVQEGNIVIALTRTIISSGLKVAVVPENYHGALVNQRVAALISDDKIIKQRFLYNFLCTDGVANYVRANVNTLMQPNLSINDLKKMPIPCPSLEIQNKIIHQLDTLSDETKKLEEKYQQKLNSLEELKKSILQKAFSGEF